VSPTTASEFKNIPPMPHGECNVITHLIDLGKPPTTIGTSKLCCELCAIWIAGVNKHIGQSGDNRRWVVGRTHGKLYYWQPPQSNCPEVQAGNAAVKEYLLRKVGLMVDHCRQLGILESPSEADALPPPPGSPYHEYGDEMQE
jgi:OTT_1508-like deaminase